jgi:Na+-translocating ferredoxin:NAD+ oxidoreductase subunit B
MAFTIIDSCTGCTACERRCPTAAIHGVKKEMFYIDASLCIDCGACGAVCPDDAILDAHGVMCEQLKAQERPKAFVQLEKCTGCVYCVNACPFDCITMEKAPPSITGGAGIATTVAVVETKKCTGCTVCELDCPYDAIHIWRQDDERAKVLTEHNKKLWIRPQAA